MAAYKSHRKSWPDLPPDLLGIVLRRLPSLADRVRLRAVCRPWRSTAGLLPAPPPQLPWLAFSDGTLLDFANATEHHVRLPSDACCYSAGEHMFFLAHDDGRCSLMDAFSNAMAPLPELAALLQAYNVDPRDKIDKVVVSKAHDDQPLVVAVQVYTGAVVVSTCRPAGEINSCLVMRDHSTVDIALFRGKVYALSEDEGLLALEINAGRLGDPTVKPARCGTVWIEEAPRLGKWERDLMMGFRDESEVWRYLVESNGKLLMVKRWISVPCGIDSVYRKDMERTCGFEVLEADLTDGRPLFGRWRKVCSLDGQALFVGSPSSKSAPAGGADGAREDCIYFVHQYFGMEPDDPVQDSGVYSMKDGTIKQLLPQTAAALQWNTRQFPAWFFPVQV